ncbi:MAG: 6-carboxytetrahydropterin synthase [Candidatus Latescibacterota bacterium]|nr:MAG: 6-carboxytetrahydropterin synthase [Candidatus Latescibacterota bacterium]
MRVSRDFGFEAAHRLPDYGGRCEALHGHSWKLRVTVEAPVGPNGLAFDFLELEREVRAKVLARLEHSYLNDIIEVPSAENLAVWAWGALARLPLAEIMIWESADCVVTYDGPGESEPGRGA